MSTQHIIHMTAIRLREDSDYAWRFYRCGAFDEVRPSL